MSRETILRYQLGRLIAGPLPELDADLRMWAEQQERSEPEAHDTESMCDNVQDAGIIQSDVSNHSTKDPHSLQELVELADEELQRFHPNFSMATRRRRGKTCSLIGY